MSILSQERNNTLKIFVQDELDKKSTLELLELLEYENSIELNLFSIQSIPKNIVIKLHTLKDRLEIFTDENSIKSYLLNLGFSLTFKDSKKRQTTQSKFDAIVLGGSAGSLSKFIEIIKALPKSEITIFIVMHQLAQKESKLSDVLKNFNLDYNIVEAKSDMKIEPSTIYTAPAAKHLIVASGYIFLTDSPKRNYAKPSISTSFESISNEYKNSLLAVLVSGYGNDGSDSLKTLMENSSTVIIQDPNECEAKAMVENAIGTKNYNSVLPLKKIIEFIQINISTDFLNSFDLKDFLDKIYEKYGYDYREYDLKHIRRRVEHFYNLYNLKSFEEFESLVLNDKRVFKELFLNISINVTTFFRNPEIFKVLKKSVLPKLDSFVDIKIWCAGCSSGEEPYSIAIILKELGLLDRSLIYATDLNNLILEHAKNGLFSKESYNLFLKHYYQSGGEESFSEYFNDYGEFVEIKEELKSKILFFKHNLSIDSKINDFQLIFCRNVIIYFNEKLKSKVFNLFSESLDSYGFLILGESENLNRIEFEVVDKTNKIYKRSLCKI